jgi:hypothetical protein
MPPPRNDKAFVRIATLDQVAVEAGRRQTVFVIAAIALILLAIGNLVFSRGMAEPTHWGPFTECDGVRLHYLDRVIPPLCAWCCSMATPR